MFLFIKPTEDQPNPIIADHRLPTHIHIHNDYSLQCLNLRFKILREGGAWVRCPELAFVHVKFIDLYSRWLPQRTTVITKSAIGGRDQHW